MRTHVWLLSASFLGLAACNSDERGVADVDRIRAALDECGDLDQPCCDIEEYGYECAAGGCSDPSGNGVCEPANDLDVSSCGTLGGDPLSCRDGYNRDVPTYGPKAKSGTWECANDGQADLIWVDCRPDCRPEPPDDRANPPPGVHMEAVCGTSVHWFEAGCCIYAEWWDPYGKNANVPNPCE